ncbi:hypothetical protein AB0C84_25025 [Actinomadura sp. NPDC048955]|uniref:hypothetical protein n=1 Tax=Actinomadura sp. NPDC048955 TaxID=3158228 RepID=UPI0033D25090
MRHGKAAVLGLVVGAGTLGMAAPAMADPGDVIVKPAQARPGETVTVVGKKCQVDGTAGSLAFVGGAVPLNGAEEVDGRAGIATVKKDTFAGTYTVLVRCGAYKGTGEVHVVDGKARPMARPTPTGGPATGVGGGAGGGNTVLLAGGGVLVLGGIGAGAITIRRRNGAKA